MNEFICTACMGVTAAVAIFTFCCFVSWVMGLRKRFRRLEYEAKYSSAHRDEWTQRHKWQIEDLEKNVARLSVAVGKLTLPAKGGKT